MKVIQKPTKIKEPLSFGKIIKRSVLFILFLIALLFLAYLLIIKPLQIRHDRQNFEKADASIMQLEKKIEGLIGKPTSVTHNKRCAYSSAEYNRGILSCGTTIAIAYPVNDESAAKDKISRFSSLISNTIYYNSGDQSTKGVAVVNLTKDASQEFRKFGGVSCEVSYIFPAENYENKLVPGLSGTNLIIALICGGTAKAEHYPVLER